MASAEGYPEHHPDTLLAALGEGDLVVTANRRLAAYLTDRYDRLQRARGVTAWAAPNMLSLSAWVGALREAAWPDRPVLGPHQAEWMWERIIAESGEAHPLLNRSAAARKAWEAWELMVRWRLPLDTADLTPEVRAFAGWAEAYQAELARGGWADPAADVAEAVAWLDRAALPGSVWFSGFDRVSPDLMALKRALAANGCRVADLPPFSCPDGTRKRLVAVDPEAEAVLAARWARGRIERDPAAVIGIVVPDLSAYRRDLVRALTDQLEPGRVPGAGTRAVNVSLGEPLAQVPVVAGALALLAVGHAAVPVADLTALLRGPYLGWAETAARALAAARIGAERRGELSLRRLFRILQAAEPPLPHTGERLGAWLALLDRERRAERPSVWARRFSDLLDALGWPGELPQDSAAYQAVSKWQELLLQFASLDAVSGSLGRAEAVSRLAALAGRTVFQPEGEAAPVQVLGVLEAAGMRFDHLWLMGFSDELWPPSPAPNPFLPLARQRALAMPRAGAVSELAFARGVSERLLVAAPEVVVSYPQQIAGRGVGISPLFARVPAADPAADPDGLAEDVSRARTLSATDALERMDDRIGPPLETGGAVAGGVSVFTDQAACPFKAFASHRLGARHDEEAEPGLDAAGRGSLAHKALEILWRGLKSADGLREAEADGTLPERLQGAAGQAVARACADTGLSDGFAAVETRRIIALMEAWLARERERALFTVIGTEERGQASAGGVTVRTIIDRIDRLADGREVLIDYKTGKASPNDWFGERPDAPQLPLYLTERGGRVAALAFGKLKKGDVGFAGLSDTPDLLPKVQPVDTAKLPDGAAPDWTAMQADWRRVLDALGISYARGEAAVSPKKRPDSCTFCDLDPLCRVWELEVGIGDDD